MLSDWLYQQIGTQPFDGLVNVDPAVWSALYAIGGVLETTLPEIFAATYEAELAGARQRLLAQLGRDDAGPGTA